MKTGQALAPFITLKTADHLSVLLIALAVDDIFGIRKLYLMIAAIA